MLLSERFNQRHKQIIKMISCGEISDITTFVKKFITFKECCYKIEKITETKKKYLEKKEFVHKEYEKQLRENNPKYELLSKIDVTKIYSDLGINLSNINKDINKEKPFIKHEHFNRSRVVCGKEYSFDLLNECVLVSHDFRGELFDFLIVWVYLKRECLILEVEKEVCKGDIEFFFTERDNGKGDEYLKKSLTDNIIYPMYNGSDENFSDTLIEFEDELLLIAEAFINKKIIPTPDLNLFVNDEFKTTQEKVNAETIKQGRISIKQGRISISQGHTSIKQAKKAIIISFIAVLITLFSTLFSIGFTIWSANDNKTNSKLNEISDSISSLGNKLLDSQKHISTYSGLSAKSLSEISEQLKKINDEIQKLRQEQK